MTTMLEAPAPLVTATPAPTVAEIKHQTLADVVRALGGIHLSRIRVNPAIGTATAADLLNPNSKQCELVEQTIVEKAKGFFEGRLAFYLGVILETWLIQNDLGFCNGEGAYTQFAPGLVRIPDVSFFRWDRVGGKQVPQAAICAFAPNLAVEIMSEGNTKAEMERKRHEYFAAGVELVWIVEPQQQTIEVWTTDRDCHILTIEDTLTGGTVLPGFELKITDWFQRASGVTPGDT